MKKIISTTFLFGMLLSAGMFSAQQLSQAKMKAINSDNVAAFKKQFAPGDYNKCFTIGQEAYTPLGFSALYGSNTIVKFLLDSKVNVNKKCKEKTPLELAEIGKREETAQLLTQHGAIKN
ncbi:MAG: ankyrin repeat domain-containing protein [Chryseobacterium sp.]|uniref:ankyrin repeat domain-containing protein n=1 Tax=Chryseobacterium sp. TaxID=1871047 RepID=UPI0025B8C653|nr:ankyrin repeat domain-containing protein [Chryseobacterium sp.]MCJ7933485.1 ankyrin repeat domain-containing protein [Chryseobacterium sp.]